MVFVGRALPDYQPSSASAPLAEHATHTLTQHRWPAAAACKPPRILLPPTPTRLVELDDRIDTDQNLITWSKHESLDEIDDDEPEPHPLAEVPELGDISEEASDGVFSENMHCVSKSGHFGDNVSSRGEIGPRRKKLPISLTATYGGGGGAGTHYRFVAFKSLRTGKEGQNITILLS